MFLLNISTIFLYSPLREKRILVHLTTSGAGIIIIVRGA